jgi:mono/diheme cytochrome c family protein
LCWLGRTFTFSLALRAPRGDNTTISPRPPAYYPTWVLAMPRCFLPLFLGVLLLSPRLASAAPPATFEGQVRPLLKAYCFECHGEGPKLRGGLDLRLTRFIAKGGDNGAAVVAGKPDDSLMWQKVNDNQMPPGKVKLTDAQRDILRRWIADGAKTERPEPEKLGDGFFLSSDDRAWWAFQPVRHPEQPRVEGELVRTAVDAFLLQKLRAKGLTFSPEADRRTLIRRATFDLHGLPPTPEEVESFVNDPAPDAYEKLLDRLLASPRYGERWGRHWLDVAGYADSEGFSPDDAPRPHAWKYRDYVIRSFNADRPFNELIVEQLAGDELVRPPYPSLAPADLDKLIATGFLRLAPDGTGARDVDQKTARNQVVSDTIKIVSSAFLGLTVGCAQCHNHRYDPIPQTDYYRLRALFEPALDAKNWKPPAARRVSLYTDADRAKAKEIEAEAAKIDQDRLKKQQEFIDATLQKELAKLSEDIREPVKQARATPDAKRTAEQKRLLMEHPSVNVSAGSLYLYDSKAADELKKLADQAAALRATKPVEDFVRALTETPGTMPTTHLFHRGDPDQPKQPVAPGGLTALDERWPLGLDKDPALPTSGRRLAFARWLTSGEHPLTARVLVNRVWLHHFGRGLVGTSAEFGRLGEQPTHPELLDWLASEFVGNGHWSLKHLHKLLMTSHAYRQASKRDAERDRIDPDNRLLSRMSVRRLEAEAVRDSVLAVSGALELKAFGPPVPVRENNEGQVVVGKGMKDLARGTVAEVPLPPGEVFRRSVYIEVRRTLPLGVLETFDAATTEPNCEARLSSTVTPQALLLMNSELLVQLSERFAARVQKDAGPDGKAQVLRAWRLAFGREPSETQVREAVAFLDAQTALFKATPEKPPEKPKDGKPAPEPPSPELRALTLWCQALLSANRFLYVD